MNISNHMKCLAIAGASFFFLSACVATTDSALDTETDSQSTTIVNTSEAAVPSASSVSESTTPPTSMSRSDDPLPAQCNTDPRTSDFGQYLAQSKIPLGELGETPNSVSQVPGSFYYFQMGENGFDSCAELSYLVLNGSNGNEQGSAGTGASIADSVVLFHHGKIVTNPAPFEMKAVEAVHRVSDNEIEVVYGHAGGATAEGVTEQYTFNFLIENGGLTGRGELPDEVDGHMRLFLG